MAKCRSIRQKRSDIFAPFGVLLCTLSLQNAAFGSDAKSKGTLKKLKWHVKMHEKNAVELKEKRGDIFPPLGVPLCA